MRPALPLRPTLQALLAAAALALLPTGCQKPASDADALELRIYDPPKGAARAIANMLNSTMYLNEHKTAGRCQLTPDGRVAFLATAEVQKGAEALVAEVSKHPPPVDQTIELRYWVLLGRPAAGNAEPPPAELAEIAPALAEISRAAGPQTFTVAQRARLSSLSSERAKVQADRLEVTQ